MLLIKIRYIVSTLVRFFRYAITRAVLLFFAVVVSVYLTILVTFNSGVIESEMTGNRFKGWLSGIFAPSLAKPVGQLITQLDFVTTVDLLIDGLTLTYTPGDQLGSGILSGEWENLGKIILDALPRSLLLFGTANLLLFFASVGISLYLSRHYGSRLDRFFIALSPLSSIPSWVYGLLFTIFAAKVLNFHAGSSLTSWPGEFTLEAVWSVARRLMLPILAIFISKIFQGIYAWRTFFLIYSSEDYVELATAKGLPNRDILRRYILRPVMPNLLTNFAMIMIGIWQEALIIELFFGVSGIGQLFYRALQNARWNMILIVQLTVVFAYLLAFLVFILDILYAFVDPRIHVGGGDQASEAVAVRKKFSLSGLFRRPKQWKAPPLELNWQSLHPQTSETLITQAAPVPLQTELSSPPRLREASARLPGSAGQSLHDRTLQVGQRLAEAGVLILANDVFWLTPAEIQYAVEALEMGYPPRTLNKVVRERRTTWHPVTVESSSLPSAVQHPQSIPELSETPRNLASYPNRLKGLIRELMRYPSAVAGMVVILVLLATSLYTLVKYPYAKTIPLWRGDEALWLRNPRLASPAWFNLFRKDKLPDTILMNSQKDPDLKQVSVLSDTSSQIVFTFGFDYPYTVPPQEILLILNNLYKEKHPFVHMSWVKPDGTEIDMGNLTVTSSYTHYFSLDERLERKLKNRVVLQGLFAQPVEQSDTSQPNEETPAVQQGHYTLRVEATTFEAGSDVEAEFVLQGLVYGLAGTDNNRRDLIMGLLWGLPIALSFGFLGAVGASLITMMIAAISTWFGGWVDSLVQRITEINMVLPMYPLIILVYITYAKSVWLILGVAVLLNIFTSAIKNYRAAFLQIKQAPYIVAAQAYGVGNWRMIFYYLLPRILPIIVPQIVSMIPGLVFLEATLAYLNVFDPVLPTWGKILVGAFQYGSTAGAYYWMMGPISLLLLTGLAFAWLGFALDRVLNPRLRER